MSDSEGNFAADTEFRRLLVRDETIDLPTVALEIARDAYPDLDFQPTLAWIRERGRDLAPRMARAAGDEELLAQLGNLIGGEFGIKGSRDAYDSPDGSFPHRAIATGTGIPICLSVLYIGVARAAGVDLTGVCAPGHFLARYDTLDQPLFVDAFAGGRVLTQAEVFARLSAQTHVSKAELRPLLEPASARAIVLRILNNLKALYANRDEWAAAWPVQQRLCALSPQSFAERRDLGFIALKSGRSSEAISILETLLKTAPKDERSMIEATLRSATREMARWN
jgi:regulator of sirC expression with transglutaminase-like and TPR domain